MRNNDSFDPVAGTACTLAPGLRRILAPNPSPMTYRGTNTYLVGTRGIAVIDPGPNDPAHLQAILAALRQGQRITHIFVTHAHLDHSPLALRLASATGAPVLAFGDAAAGRSPAMTRLASGGIIGGGEGVDTEFMPDSCVADDEEVVGDGWRIKALWTPGHFGNHLCFAWNDTVFTGDLVMGWASSLVSPPDGDLTQFMASCNRLRMHGASVLHPGHGAPVPEPAARIDWLLAHRKTREGEILAQLSVSPATAAVLTHKIYTATPPQLLPAATRNVLAHLIDLQGRGIVCAGGTLNAEATFSLVDVTRDRHGAR